MLMVRHDDDDDDDIFIGIYLLSFTITDELYSQRVLQFNVLMSDN